MHPSWKPKNLIRSANRACNFPENTCPSSRHVLRIGEALIKGEKYHMIDEEPEHVGMSLLSTVKSLFKARTEIDRLRAKLGMPSRLEQSMAEFAKNPIKFGED